jgi:hypothetical protein
LKKLLLKVDGVCQEELFETPEDLERCLVRIGEFYRSFSSKSNGSPYYAEVSLYFDKSMTLKYLKGEDLVRIKRGSKVAKVPLEEVSLSGYIGEFDPFLLVEFFPTNPLVMDEVAWVYADRMDFTICGWMGAPPKPGAITGLINRAEQKINKMIDKILLSSAA